MTMRGFCGMALVLAACGEDGEPNSPPISSGESAMLTVGSSVSVGTDTEGTDGTATMSGGTVTTSATESSGSGGAPFTVLTGAFIDGGAAVNLPIECAIKFYEPGQVDASTGMEQGGFIFQLGGFIIDAYPQQFAIESTEVTMVERGQEGYVAAACAADKDGIFDDGLVGYYPGLPLELVTVPATNLNIPIESM